MYSVYKTYMFLSTKYDLTNVLLSLNFCLKNMRMSCWSTIKCAICSWPKTNVVDLGTDFGDFHDGFNCKYFKSLLACVKERKMP